jgi:hypothetical protein
MRTFFTTMRHRISLLPSQLARPRRGRYRARPPRTALG